MSSKKIIASDGRSIFGVAVSPKTIEIVRGNHKFTVTGTNFSIVGTAARGKRITSVVVKDSELDESLIDIASDEDFDKDGRFIDRTKKQGDEGDDNDADADDATDDEADEADDDKDDGAAAD